MPWVYKVSARAFYLNGTYKLMLNTQVGRDIGMIPQMSV